MGYAESRLLVSIKFPFTDLPNAMMSSLDRGSSPPSTASQSRPEEEGRGTMLPVPQRLHRTPLGDELFRTKTPFETYRFSPVKKGEELGWPRRVARWAARVPYLLVKWLLIEPVTFSAMVLRWLFSPTYSFYAERVFGRSPLRAAKKGVQTSVSSTALMVAMARHAGKLLELNGDYLAYHFLPFEMRLSGYWNAVGRPLFSTENRRAFRLLSSIQCRTVGFDRLVVNANKRQVVLLGAGMDTRSYRLTPERLTAIANSKQSSIKIERFFEVDIASTQKFKRSVVDAYPNDFPTNRVVYVPVDFSRESFLERLVANGFNAKEESVLVLEGVSYYLTWEALKETLLKIASLPPGTLLGMDYITEMSNSPRLTGLTKIVESMGEPMRFFLKESETPEQVFTPLGFDLIAHLGADAMAETFLPASIGPGIVAPHSSLIILRVNGKSAP